VRLKYANHHTAKAGCWILDFGCWLKEKSAGFNQHPKSKIRHPILEGELHRHLVEVHYVQENLVGGCGGSAVTLRGGCGEKRKGPQ
jgi:hypothetical protein